MKKYIPLALIIATQTFGSELVWDPVAGAVGYKVYVGTQSGVYTQTNDVGNVTQISINGLKNTGLTNYFVVTAYSSIGLESDFSSETNAVFIKAPNKPRIVK